MYITQSDFVFILGLCGWVFISLKPLILKNPCYCHPLQQEAIFDFIMIYEVWIKLKRVAIQILQYSFRNNLKLTLFGWIQYLGD